jgi:tetratricopeptide (TPR) repeat protein
VSFIRRKWLVSLLLFLVSLGVYLPSLRNGFVWDDVETIEQSYYIYNASSMGAMFIPPEKESKDALYYRPLIYASMVLDKALWGITSFGFHLSNIVLNAFSTVCAYWFVLLLLGVSGCERRYGAAFIAGSLFAFYPMHVESVSWVSGRSDVLCALFFFLALIFHILSLRKTGFLVLTAAFFALSLSSKEVAVVFPVTALAFDLINRSQGRKANILRYAVYASVLALFFYLRGRTYVNFPELSSVRVPGGTPVHEGVIQAAGILGAVKVILVSYMYYFTKLVFPYTFNAFTAKAPGGPANVISSVAAFGLLLLGVFYSIKKRYDVSAFALIWIPVTLLPSVLIALTDIPSASVAERHLYLPSAGFCLFLAWIFTRAPVSVRRDRILLAAAFILTASYLFFTVDRQRVWRDGVSLWGDTVGKSPGSAIPHINYGLALLDVGKDDEALKELLRNFDEGVEIDDRGRSVTASNIGVVYINKKDVRNAEKWFLKAYVYDPGYYKTSYHLGLVLYLKGKSGGSREDYVSALGYLDKSLQMRPFYGKAYLLQAMIYGELGERDKARDSAERALESGLTDKLAAKARKIISAPD